MTAAAARTIVVDDALAPASIFARAGLPESRMEAWVLGRALVAGETLTLSTTTRDGMTIVEARDANGVVVLGARRAP